MEPWPQWSQCAHAWLAAKPSSCTSKHSINKTTCQRHMWRPAINKRAGRHKRRDLSMDIRWAAWRPSLRNLVMRLVKGRGTQRWGWFSASTAAAFAAGGVLLAGDWRWERSWLGLLDHRPGKDRFPCMVWSGIAVRLTCETNNDHLWPVFAFYEIFNFLLYFYLFVSY